MPLYSDFGLYYSPHLSTTPSYYSSPFLGTSGRSSGLGLFPAPRVIPRVSPLLPSIPETSTYSSSRSRTSALDRYIPPPSTQSRYKPLRIDTADIDVSSNRYGSSSHAPATPQRDNTIKRGRTVVRLHTKKCKESPGVETRRRMTPGEKLMQKFLILDKAEEEAKAARRKRLEEQEIRERAEAELARLQALAAGKGEVLNTPASDSASVADTSPKNFPTVGGITENAALDILLSATEDEEQVSGGEITRSSSSGTVKRRKSKGTVKVTKKKSKTRKSSLAEGDETDTPNGSGEDPVCTLQRRNTVRFRRNSQDTDAFPEVDLTAGSRRSSIDQSLPGSRRSSLDSSTGDEIPLAIQKKGTVKRRREPPHRIVVEDVSVENGSSNGSLNSPKFIVEDVKVEQSPAPKVFRYEVIVEDVEGESLTTKPKVAKGGGKKKKKASDSDTASSESDAISVPKMKGAVSQNKGEKKDSTTKSFQKSQTPKEVETAAARLNDRKTDEINFKTKEDAQNLPLGNEGKEDKGTNKNEKGVKQTNEKNKLNQKNVQGNKCIPQTITAPKNAQSGEKPNIQSKEKNVLERKQPKRQADPSPVEDSPEKETKESVFNFWDELKPDEESGSVKPTLPKKEPVLPDISDVSKSNTDVETVKQVQDKKPVPKWKEKLQADKNTLSNKIEESKEKSVINDNKKQVNNQKGFLPSSKVEDLSKDSKLVGEKSKQENQILVDPLLVKKGKVDEEKTTAFPASTLNKENISSEKTKTNNIARSGKTEEETNLKNELLHPTKTDQKKPDEVKKKAALPNTPSASEKGSTDLTGKKLTEPTEKSKDSKNTSKDAPSLDKIPVLKDVNQGSSLNSNNNNIHTNKKVESPQSPTKKFFTNTKEEGNKPAVLTEVGVPKRQDNLSKVEVKSQKPPWAKGIVNEKSKDDLSKGESDKPTTGKLFGEKNKEVSPNKEVASHIATKKLVGPDGTETSTKDKISSSSATSNKIVGEENKGGESTMKNLVTQKSKESSLKDELSSPTKILDGQKEKKEPPNDGTPTQSKEDESDKPVTPRKLVGQKSKENEVTAPSTQKKLVGPKSKEDTPKEATTTPITGKKLVGQKSKDEAFTPTTTKQLDGQKSREDASKDETTTPNKTNTLVEQKSKGDELAKHAAPKKLVGQKNKKDESATSNTAKILLDQKSKEDEPATPVPSKKLVGKKSKEEETAKPVAPKKLVGQKSKEDESTKPAAPKKLVAQKNKEEEIEKPISPKKLVGEESKGDESTKPFQKKLVGQKSKEDESDKSAPKKLVEQKSKEDESVKPAPKKLVEQKSKEDESAKPTVPKKLAAQKSKEDESDKPVSKKLVGQKSKEGDSDTPTTAKKLIGQKGKQVSPDEANKQTPSPAVGKKIIGKAKVDVAQTNDKIVTAKSNVDKKEEKGCASKPASVGTKVGVKVQQSPGSDADSEESSSEDEDSTPRNSTLTNSSCGSTSSSGSSSSDSGFDSRPSSVPVSSTASEASGSREPGSPAPSAYSATLDPYSEDAGLLQSGSVASGRTTPPATSLPRFRKYTVDDFQFLKLLGKGTFGKVLLAELRGTDRHYAVKCLKKDVVLEDDDVECTLIERKVLALGTKHPYLCHLFCTFQTESHLLFVMEYLNGGDLMFHIQQSGRFPEPRARFYAAEIVCGLKFLHKKGIVYRDLKLDNILLDYEGHVRIADFGMCKLQIFLDRTADTFCGTPDYMAPEIIKGLKYNQCVDWWSFGVLTFEMLVGVSPFSGCDEDELFWSICNEQPQYPRFLSREAHSLLSSLLEKDALKRLGTPDSPKGDVPDHVFFRSIDWGALERRELEPPFRPRLKHPLDVQYFDTAFTAEQPELTPVDASILQSMDQAQFHGFSYTNPNATD